MKFLTLAIATFVIGACHKDHNDDSHGGGNGSINNIDRDFSQMASMANFAEIDAGTLAASKATNDGIKEFGQHMVDEHSNSKNELHQIADSLNLSAPDSLDAEHVALKATLNTLNGRAFDSTYITAQVNDHKKVIDLFEKEISLGANERLIHFAKTQLPHLHEHLETADSLKTNL